MFQCSGEWVNLSNRKFDICVDWDANVASSNHPPPPIQYDLAVNYVKIMSCELSFIIS